ncbi:MAG: NAD(+)/NADH kinase [Actinomycetes bacterium]|jgi:NAD+ kinase|nr:NAD(+)/NADH kinase [Actinomycetes bacterium]
MSKAKRVAIVANEADAAAMAAASKLRLWAREVGGVDVFPLRGDRSSAADLTPDLVVALGGDGTILRAVRELGSWEAPILGVKFGRLGFLSGAPSAELMTATAAALEGRTAVEARALLEVSAWAGAEKDARLLGSWTALNEAVVGRGTRPGVVTTRLLIDGHEIYTQTGDGLIAATATGSTAYALSAGGPVLSPGYGGMVLVALASHTLVSRAIVTAPDDEVRITLPDSTRAAASLIIDGENVLDDFSFADIHISERTVSLVKLDGRLFFDTLAAEFFRNP